MSTIFYVLFIVVTLIGAFILERHQRTMFCVSALKRSGFGDVVELDGHVGRGTRRLGGASTLEATVTPIDGAKAAKIALVFASTPALPSLNTKNQGVALTGASTATLGVGEERWVASLAEVLHCLGIPAPARFAECEAAFFFDVDAIVTTEFDTTVHATAFTTRSREYEARLSRMGFRERLSAPHKQDATRSQTICDALDPLVELAQALDGAIRRHADAAPVALWWRAWRGTRAAKARAAALTILARISDHDRAELVASLGPDAEALTARGGLSLSQDGSSRGALTPAADQGGLSQVE